MIRGITYRKYQLARAHSGRTIGQLRGFIATNGLSDFRLVDMVFTMPGEVSEALSRMAKGRDAAWRAFNRVYAQLPGIVGCDDGEFAAESCLHV